MGFDINGEITTRLHYKDVALIAVAIGIYIDNYEKTAGDDTIKRMKRIVDRLGNELYNVKK